MEVPGSYEEGTRAKEIKTTEKSATEIFEHHTSFAGVLPSWATEFDGGIRTKLQQFYVYYYVLVKSASAGFRVGGPKQAHRPVRLVRGRRLGRGSSSTRVVWNTLSLSSAVHVSPVCQESLRTRARVALMRWRRLARRQAVDTGSPW